MAQRLPLAYQFTTRAHNGQPITVAIAKCHKCGRTEEIPYHGRNVPEFIAQAFQRQGWDFDPWHANRCRCSLCVGERTANRSTNDTDSLLHKQEKSMAPRVLPAKPAAPLAVVPKVASDQAVEEVRDPTLREIRVIMAALDEHFDEGKGAFFAGWDDRKIAETFNLPMAMVTKVRREAFGDIKVPKEIEELQREFTDIFNRLTAAESKLQKVLATYGK